MSGGAGLAAGLSIPLLLAYVEQEYQLHAICVDIITPNEKTGRILRTSCTPTRGAGHALLHAQCFVFNKVQPAQSLGDIAS
jgi:hypothetical protein